MGFLASGQGWGQPATQSLQIESHLCFVLDKSWGDWLLLCEVVIPGSLRKHACLPPQTKISMIICSEEWWGLCFFYEVIAMPTLLWKKACRPPYLFPRAWALLCEEGTRRRIFTGTDNDCLRSGDSSWSASFFLLNKNMHFFWSEALYFYWG